MSQDEQKGPEAKPSPYVNIKQLRAMLGVSKGKMAQLMKSGKIPWIPNAWDTRIKLVKREDAEALAAEAKAMGKELPGAA